LKYGKVGVIGLGYVGLSLAAALAHVGYNVLGLDIDSRKIEHLQRTYSPEIYEPGLHLALQRNKDRVEFTDDYDRLMIECDDLLVTIGTPLEKNKPLFQGLEDVIGAIGKRLRKGQLVVLKSTVVPGTTEKISRELEKWHGLVSGRDFHIAFCPERTIEGLAMHELYTLPKIVGAMSPEGAERAARIFRKLGGEVLQVSSPRVAEMCKLVDNLYRAMNIALANELGGICEKLAIDAYEVVSAVNKAYERTHIFFPGLGADGPCLSKDPEILRYCGEQINADTRLIDVTITKNEESTLRVAGIVVEFLQTMKIERPVISLVGLAFKGFPETDDVRGSPALKLYGVLNKELSTAQFRFHDPIVQRFLDHPVIRDLDECIDGANVIIFLTNHRSLMNISASIVFRAASRPLLVIDCWHNLGRPVGPEQSDENIKIFRMGDGTS
jgi:UDP-N-acetyl-D-mannosaminuronic acid dehydrogenase